MIIKTQDAHCISIALVGCSAIPLDRLGIGSLVLLYTLAIVIHDAQVLLRLRIALVGCSAIPLERLGIVLLHTLAIVIHDAQVVLRLRIALVGCSAIPPDRLGIGSLVLLCTLALL